MAVKVSVKFDERRRRRLIRRGREGPFTDPFTLVTSDPTAPGGVLIRSYPPTVEASGTPGANARLGLFVTQDELEAWNLRARNLDPAGHNFHSQGDEFTNSPADWDRIVTRRNAYMTTPSNYDWQGITQDWPNPIINGAAIFNLVVPEKDENDASGFLMDAAFWAMVLGSTHLDPGDRTITATARDAVINQIEATITSIRTTQYNNFTNTTRWNPNNQGTGLDPCTRICMHMLGYIQAYDFCQIANPDAWSAANKEAFIEWVWALEPWFGDGGTESVIHRRRNGQTSLTTGLGTAAAAAPFDGSAFWSGGPAELTISHKLDNHLSPMTSMLTLIGLLAELEQTRSGVTTLSGAAISKAKDYTRWMAKSYLQNEFFAQAAGNNGGNGSGNRAGAGQLYRGVGSTSEDGWKYSVEWLSKLLIGVDALARAGEDASYDLSYTNGIGGTGGGVDTSGSVLSDTYFANPGPKTFHRAAQQILRYIIETGTDSHPWRYASTTGTVLNRRIDSRDEVANINRSEEWAMLHAVGRWNDPLITAIYERSAAGAPAHPVNPRSGGTWIQCGAAGIFPGACFMFAYLEDINRYG